MRRSGTLVLGIAFVVVAALLGGRAIRNDGATEAGRAARSEPEAATAPTLVGDAAASGTGAMSPDGAGETQRPAAPNDGDRGDVAVLVRAGGAPLGGATVRLRRKGDPRPLATRTTDAAGAVRFTDVAGRASHAVEAFAHGYRPEAVPVPEVDPVVVELAPGIPFEGRVLAMEDRRSIAGARVVVNDYGELELPPTDDEGRFRVPGVEDDEECSVWAEAPGRCAASTPVRVEAGRAEPDIVLVLERCAWLEGVVLSAEGRPVQGATVRAGVSVPDEPIGSGRQDDPAARFAYDDWLYKDDSYGGVPVVTTETAEDGTFRLEGLRKDTVYEVRAEAPEHAASLPVPLSTTDAPERHVSTLRLRAPATVLVTVRVAEGQDLPETVRVRVFQEERPLLPSRVSGGRFRHTGVAPGPAYAFAQASGFVPVAERIEVPERGKVQVSLSLERGATVEGLVLDEDASPVARAAVEATSESLDPRGTSTGYLSRSQKTRADDEGRFRIEGLPPGPTLVIARGNDDAGRSLAVRERLRCVAPVSDLRVVVGRLASVRARLVRPDGQPFEGPARVWTTRRENGSVSGGGWDMIAAGTVGRDRLEDGRYDLTVVAQGFAPLARAFEIRRGGDVDLGDVRLEEGARVIGRVLDGAGRPVEGANVYDGGSERSAKTDAAGAFVLEHLTRDRVWLTVRAPGYVETELALDPEEGVPVVVRIGKPVAVRGVVRRPSGVVEPEAAVELRRPDASAVRVPYEVDGETVEGEEEFVGSTWIFAGDDGRIDQEVPDGEYVGIWEDASGKEHVVGRWTFRVGEPREIDVVLPAE